MMPLDSLFDLSRKSCRQLVSSNFELRADALIIVEFLKLQQTPAAKGCVRPRTVVWQHPAILYRLVD